ncbi:uncharacterized protein LOC125667935 [Ostrea edulis]|uniref:uncharacterized protein LOC125667935 n=1 Tax=Ostrea edulis TaxID=37623 RepID=UPI0024AFD782|nr:uncharacterized protein LOC125667935 [Ostrea edulis]
MLTTADHQLFTRLINLCSQKATVDILITRKFATLLITLPLLNLILKMFGCVFFHEDKSLSVVGEKSKRLELLGSFQEREKVNMKWGKDIFSGVIVHVHENQDLLDAETVKAEKKVLRGKNLSSEDSVELLIAHFKKAENENQSEKRDRKRERNQTERAKESQEQDKEMSPKKKRKNVENEDKDNQIEGKDEGRKNNNEEKKNNANDEAKKNKNKPDKKNKVEEKSKKKTMEVATPKIKEKQEKKAESSVQLLTSKEMLSSSSLCEQFGLAAATQNIDNSKDDLTLTSTWALCNPELERSSVMSATVPSYDAIQPPNDVIEVFRLLLKPQIQRYMRSVITQFHETTSQIDNTMTDTCIPTYTTMSPATWTQDSNYTQPAPWTPQITEPSLHQQMPTLQISPPHSTHYMPPRQMPPQMPPQISPQITLKQIQPQITLEQMPPQISLEQSPMQHMLPNHAIPSQHVTPQKMNTAPQQMPSNHVDSPITPRRSPRKHVSTPELSDGQMTRLLSNHPLTVRRDALRKAKSAAKKVHSSKMAFTLTAKLLPAVFSCEELALSRGQGLKSKDGDKRPVLDVTKMTVLKEYVAVWCEKNGGKHGEKEVNDAVTEQISYARKKLKGKKKQDS